MSALFNVSAGTLQGVLSDIVIDTRTFQTKQFDL